MSFRHWISATLFFLTSVSLGFFVVRAAFYADLAAAIATGPASVAFAAACVSLALAGPLTRSTDEEDR